MKKLISLLLALTMVLTMGVAAFAADEWPERPITVLIPANTGGDTDTTFRTMSTEIGNQIGGVVALSNMSGGAGAVATYELLDYAPDGYTGIWHHYDSILLTMKGTMEERYDEYLDIAAVIPAVGFEYAVLVNKSLGIETFDDFIAYAKEHPGELVCATEAGSWNHLFDMFLESTCGIEMNVVDFGSAADRLAALLGGNCDVMLDNLSTVASYPDDLIALGVCSTERKDYAPDVPTLTELGYEVVSEKFYYFGFRSGTDPEIVEKMGKAIEAAAQTEETAEMFAKYNVTEWPVLTGQDALDYLHAFEEKYTPYIDLMLQE